MSAAAPGYSRDMTGLSLKLRSPSLPLLPAGDSLAAFALHAERSELAGAALLPAAASGVCATIAWSVAEAADIYVEKTLFDAFTPVNATINAVRGRRRRAWLSLALIGNMRRRR